MKAAVRTARRHRRRRHVVEQTVILVEIDDQHGPGPHLRVCRQGIEHTGGIVGAFGRAGGSGVLGIDVGRDHPRDLRQLVGQDVRLELVEIAGAQAATGNVDQRPISRLVRLAVQLEADERIVVEIIIHVLVDLPIDAGGLQPLGIGDPLIAAMAVLV